MAMEIIQDYGAQVSIVVAGNLISQLIWERVRRVVTRSDEPAVEEVLSGNFGELRPEDIESGLSFLGLETKEACFFATPGHKLYPNTPHPADREALAFVSGLAGLKQSVVEDKNVVHDVHSPIRPTFQGTQVILGGPNSQPWARVIIEFDFVYDDPDHPKYHDADCLARRADAALPLPYVGTANEDGKDVESVPQRASLGGKLSRRPRPVWRFAGPDPGVGKPEILHGYRTLDWLSITRWRNFLSPVWGSAEEGYIVHVDGASGVGTRGVRLIFQPGVVKALNERLEGAREFQVLLPIEVAYTRRGMYPFQIDLSRALILPLYGLTEGIYKKARARVTQRVGDLVRGLPA